MSNDIQGQIREFINGLTPEFRLRRHSDGDLLPIHMIRPAITGDLIYGYHPGENRLILINESLEPRAWVIRPACVERGKDGVWTLRLSDKSYHNVEDWLHNATKEIVLSVAQAIREATTIDDLVTMVSCAQCEESFEVLSARIYDKPYSVECKNCGADLLVEGNRVTGEVIVGDKTNE